MRIRLTQLCYFVVLLVLALAYPALASANVRFKIQLSPALSAEPVSGRLLVFMVQGTESLDVVEPSLFELDKVWVSAREVHSLLPGESIEIDPDLLAYPAAFSSAPAGTYQIMALLDVNHSYPYSQMGPGDLRSVVVAAKDLKPASGEVISLTLAKRIEEQPFQETESIKLVTFQSRVLSAFWGRSIMMRAAVVLPRGYAKLGNATYPTIYRVHGFGGSHLTAQRTGPGLLKKMADGTLPEMINVYLDGSCPFGHHEFADSANNGPWGQALTKEFIPYLEGKFRMDKVARGRFLTGHSSGGWSTLWLQVNYPEVFGGTWSTSPDPIDFRTFSGIDLTKIPAQNFYRGSDNKPRNIFRYKGRDVFDWAKFAHFSQVVGEYGGQIESFEAVFSPRGSDGRPMPLFDRRTGAVDPLVQQAWRRYDISHILVSNWKTLGPRLKGKIHVIVGSVDNFHLEEAVYLLRDTLKPLGSDATFEVIEGRDHMDLFQGDLADRIVREMYQVARPARGKK